MNFYPDLCSLLSLCEKLFEYSKYSGIKKKNHGKLFAEAHQATQVM